MEEAPEVHAHLETHLCAFLDESMEVPGFEVSSAREGFSEGEQVVVIAGPSSLGLVRTTLEDADQRVASGELRLVAWTRMYSHERVGFDPAAALESARARQARREPLLWFGVQAMTHATSGVSIAKSA